MGRHLRCRSHRGMALVSIHEIDFSIKNRDIAVNPMGITSCRNCGERISDGALFCAYCGRKACSSFVSWGLVLRVFGAVLLTVILGFAAVLGSCAAGLASINRSDPTSKILLLNIVLALIWISSLFITFRRSG